MPLVLVPRAGVMSEIVIGSSAGLGVSIPPKPYPIEAGIQADIEDLSASIAELKGRKASDFMDTSLLKELESEGFFARLIDALAKMR